MRGAAVESQEIPWQDALAHHAAPFQIPVAALPLVVEDAPALRHGGPPAEMQAEQRGFRRFDADRHAVSGRVGFDGDAGAVPSAAFAGERQRAALEEGDGEVRRAQDIDIAIGGARGSARQRRRASRPRVPIGRGGRSLRVHESIVPGDAGGRAGGSQKQSDQTLAGRPAGTTAVTRRAESQTDEYALRHDSRWLCRGVFKELGLAALNIDIFFRASPISA